MGDERPLAASARSDQAAAHEDQDIRLLALPDQDSPAIELLLSAVVRRIGLHGGGQLPPRERVLAMTRTNTGSTPTALLAILREAGEPMTAAELRDCLERDVGDNTVSISLRRLASAGWIRKQAIENPTRHGPRVMWALQFA
jgi:hypothetical protein